MSTRRFCEIRISEEINLGDHGETRFVIVTSGAADMFEDRDQAKPFGALGSADLSAIALGKALRTLFAAMPELGDAMRAALYGRIPIDGES